MKLSMRADYALRALLTLVERYGKGPVPIRELAERNDVPKPFLEHIMLDLKAQGWVQSLAGKYGGYVLHLPPDRITLGEVVRHFEEPTPGGIGDAKSKARAQAPVARFRKAFDAIGRSTNQMLDRATLAAVYAGRPLTREESMTTEFDEGDGI